MPRPPSTPERKRELARARNRRYRAKLSEEKKHENHLRALAWKRANPGKNTANMLAQKLRKQNRIPAWANLRAIRDFYAARPEGMQVDHIIPLRGETVSGLHVLANLQYLTPKENASKKNSF